MTVTRPSRARPRLGRGLDALLPAASEALGSGPPREVPIEALHPRPDQPRRCFDSTSLEELADSIRQYGILEPLLVRPLIGREDYEVVAGERRWRAAQLAGLQRVPVVVHELTDRDAFEIALVENIQREDLSPVETARALKRLTEEFAYDIETLAKRLGKDRSTLTNHLRLLKLPDSVLEHIESSRLSEGHGRALLGAPTPAILQKLTQKAIDEGWSVRRTEHAVKAARNVTSTHGQSDTSTAPSKSTIATPNTRALERRVANATGCATVVKARSDGSGTVSLSYHSLDHLDSLLKRLETPL